jgi:spermidine/putrescine transport system permease protein
MASQVSIYDTQIVRSLLYGLVVTTATLAISYPMAYWIAFKAGRNKNLYLLLILLPFFTPFLIRTLQWKFVLADRGIFLGTLKDWGILEDDFRLLATPLAVLAGLVYNFLPFMALPLYVSLEGIDRSLIEAAQDLYASRVKAFLRVTLPLSLPGVFAGTLLTFIPAAGDFINAELLGTPRQFMIGNVIQSRFLELSDYPTAAALSFILMALMLAIVLVWARIAGTEALLGTEAERR